MKTKILIGLIVLLAAGNLYQLGQRKMPAQGVMVIPAADGAEGVWTPAAMLMTNQQVMNGLLRLADVCQVGSPMNSCSVKVATTLAALQDQRAILTLMNTPAEQRKFRPVSQQDLPAARAPAAVPHR